MDKHTPGPWFARDLDREPYVEAAKNFDGEGMVCLFYEDVTPFDSVTLTPWLRALPNAVANARVIAAAPELLAALEAMVERFATPTTERSAASYAKTNKQVVDEARAAIAKARGG